MNKVPTELLAIMDICMALELQDEAAMLLKCGLPTNLSSYSTHWKSTIEFFKALVARLKQYQNSRLNAEARPLLSDALKSLIQTQHEQRPPKPQDWKRGPVGNCTCNPCQAVNRFLVHRTQKTERFKHSEGVRNHIQSKFQSLDFLFETDRQNKPYTLIVHKTTNKFTREFNDWKTACADMSAQLKALMNPFLRQLLDADSTVINELIKNLGQQAAALPTSQPVTGKKRKAEIVDLTDD